MKLNEIDYVLIGLLVLAVYSDITKRKIPNRITMPAMLIGIIWSTINSGFNGFLFSIFGFVLGLAVFLLPYLSGGIGAGDVKLMAAIGALKGWKFTLFSSLGTAVAGGLVVVIYMIFYGNLRSTLINVLGLILRPLAKLIFKATGNKKAYELVQYFEHNKSKNGNDYIPYALAIAIGSIFVLFVDIDALFYI